jgi:hypothetical protein
MGVGVKRARIFAISYYCCNVFHDSCITYPYKMYKQPINALQFYVLFDSQNVLQHASTSSARHLQDDDNKSTTVVNYFTMIP